jgi:enoyl-CoA hydratase/carnithine racemase
VGSRSTRVLFREGRLGLVPTHGGLTRLVKLLGLARAREQLLGGEELNGEAAHAAGLLSVLAPTAASVVDLARARVERMLAREDDRRHNPMGHERAGDRLQLDGFGPGADDQPDVGETQPSP